MLRTISVLRNANPSLSIWVRSGSVCYTQHMSKLLDEAINRLRQLPEGMQEAAARALIMQLEEEPEPGDLEEVAEGWKEYWRGDFVTLDQLRHDMGLGGR